MPSASSTSSTPSSVASRLSLTSFAVVADALGELHLLNSELGHMVMSASLVTDVFNWATATVNTTVILVMQARSPSWAIAIVASVAFFVIFVVFVARPATKWAVKRTPPGDLLGKGPFMGLLLTALARGPFQLRPPDLHPPLVLRRSAPQMALSRPRPRLHPQFRW